MIAVDLSVYRYFFISLFFCQKLSKCAFTFAATNTKIMFISSFTLPSYPQEHSILYAKDGPMFGNMKCNSGNIYPFGIFPQKVERAGALELHFDTPITILYGNNGSGKTTVLNVIAEYMNASRHSAFNKSGLFYNYLDLCEAQLEERCLKKLVITSDDVFEHLLKERRKFDVFNDARDRYREEVARERVRYDRERVSIDFEDPDSIDAYRRRCQVMQNSTSKLIVQKMGVDKRGQSNGETAIDFFTDQIQSKGLYLIDEPENSLSPKMQQALADYIKVMSQELDCQFIIASHSPFFIGIEDATVYDLDAETIAPCDWRELESIQVYREFFRRLEY